MAVMKASPLGNPTPVAGNSGTDKKKKQVTSQHEQYTAKQPLWLLVHDVVEGENVIKAKGTTYLPNPDPAVSLTAPTQAELRTYENYKMRAVFYNVTGRTLEGLVGHVFSKQSIVNLTPRLDGISDNIDGEGTTLDQLAKLNLARVLSYGRAGLFTDYPKVADGETPTVEDMDKARVRPKILSYSPFDIINWWTVNIGALCLLGGVVLREYHTPEDNDPLSFGTESEVQYRVLRLDVRNMEAPVYTYEIWRRQPGAEEYSMVEGPITPAKADGTPFDEIPFQFIGWQDNTPKVNSVPLYDLATLNLSHYRNSAEFEDSVFLLGNPQLVFSGITLDWIREAWKNKGVKFGSRTAISLPANAAAELHQAQPNTLSQTALEHKEKQMVALGAALVEQKEVQRTATEAGQDESVKVSVLSSSADNVSAAVTKALEWAGMFVGEEQSETKNEKGEATKSILYELNTDFDVAKMDAQERGALIAEYQGKLISWSEARAGLKAAGVAFLDDKKAQDEIENDPFDMADALGMGVDPITGKPKQPKPGETAPAKKPGEEQPKPGAEKPPTETK